MNQTEYESHMFTDILEPIMSMTETTGELRAKAERLRIRINRKEMSCTMSFELTSLRRTHDAVLAELANRGVFPGQWNNGKQDCEREHD